MATTHRKSTRPVKRRSRRTATRRRSQAERRREAQDKLMRAAIALLVERGYAGFSTIAVASRAGVSRGARENYYKTKYDLIEAAWQAALTRAETKAKLLADNILRSADPVEDFLTSSASFFLGDDYLAMLELAMAARTDARVERIFHTLFRENRRRHDRVWIDAFARAGHAKADVARFVDVANCMFRGAALMAAFGLPKTRYRAVLEELRGIAEAYLGSRNKKAIRSSPPTGPRKARPDDRLRRGPSA
jgi:AcrR family transcriptional regulator